MKTRILSTARLSFPLACALAALLATPSVHAATFYWDQSGTAQGFGTGTGAWAQNDTSPGPGRWTTSNVGSIAGSVTQATANTDAFNFGSVYYGLGAGTITVNAVGVTMGNTTYHSLAGAIVLSGGPITFSAAPTITVNNTTNRISSAIGGAATSFTKAGNGILVLNGANTYTGATVISGGTLDLGGGTAAGSLDSTTLTLSGGSLNYTRTGGTTQSFTTTNISVAGASPISVAVGNTLNLGTVARGAGGSVNFASVGAGTVAADTASNDGTAMMPGFTHGDSWAVANGAGLAISALTSGSYTLSSVAGTASASYAGFNIDVDSSPGASDASFAANSLRFSSAAANTLTLTGTTNTLASGGILVASTVGANLSTITGGTLAGAASKDLTIIQNNPSAGLTISSVIDNFTGATALTKSGAGLLTLDNSNTFTGGVFLHGGQLTMANAGALNSTTPNNVTFASGSTGTLTLNGNNLTIPVLSGSNAGSSVIENANASNALLTINSASSSNFNGVIRNGTGDGKLALTKLGSGTLTLSGANTYTGDTTLNGGTVAISNSSSLGAGNVLVTGASRIHVNGGISPANAIDVGAGLTLQIQAGIPGTVTYSGQLTGASNITVDATLVNGITGTHAFTHANNTFTGSILMPVGSTGTGSGNDFVNFNSLGDGGTFTFRKAGHTNGIIYSGTAAITFNTRQIAIGTTFGNTAAGLFDGGGVNPINRFLNNAADPAHTVTFNTNITPGAVANNGSFFFAGSNTGDNTFAGIISNPTSGGNLGIGKADAGRWILTGANTYLGNVTIANGTLAVNAVDIAANTQPLGKSTLIQLGNSSTSGTLEYTGAANGSTDKQVVLGNLTNNNQTGAGGVSNNSTTGTLNFSNSPFNSITGTTVTTVDRTLTLGGSNTGDNTISGTIQDHVPGAAQILLTKTGTGTWILSGPNTYTGNTTVNAGTLKLAAGSLANTAITVSGTGTFAVQPGSATAISAGNNLTTAAGATLNLGGRVFDMTDSDVSTFSLVQESTFASPALTITNGATLKMNLGSAGTDLLAVTKTAAVTGTVNVTLDTAGASSLTPSTYNLVTAESGLTSATPTWQFTGGGTTATVTVGATSYNLTLNTSDTAVSVTVANTATNNYTTWAADPLKGNIPGEPASGDFDNDGISNLIEYALGMDPRVSTVPAGVLSGFTITYTKGADAIANGDVKWIIETSETLLSGSWSDAVIQNAGNTDLTISYTFTPSTPPKKFARLKVVQVL